MSRWWRPALLVLLMAAGFAALAVTGWPTVESMRAATAGTGWLAPVLFTLLFTAFTLAPAPAALMGIAAGVLFGLPIGLATTMVAVAAGALIGFGLSRSLGREVIGEIGSARLRRLDNRLRRGGIWAVAGGRLLPVIPYPVLSYACGLTSIRVRDYLLGSILGVLPSAVAFVTIGAYGGDPSSVPFLLAVAGLVVLAAGAAVAKRSRPRPVAGAPVTPADRPAVPSPRR